ncbi:MAG TPA: citryl-CoA lyase [Actinomycetota bacterium]|nr:citryl-CoA lyase [Actinomycetota bacterium]
MSDPLDGDWLRTSVGHSTPDSIVVRGRNLADDLMGHMSFADVAFLLASGREPSEGESKLFSAVLVALADHGLTPTALAARFTYTGAPEALQGALAAGLLGAGTVFLGPVEDTARFLQEILAESPADTDDPTVDLEDLAAEAVEAAVVAGRKIPGLGHPIHKETDPRTPRIYQLADETGLAGPHLRLLEHVAAAHRRATGKALPINGAGAAGAALADLGFPPFLTRGFALLARAAGLIGHLAEEAERPLGMRLWKEVDRRAAGSADKGSDSSGS